VIPWYVFVAIAIFFRVFFDIARKKALSKTHAMKFESARMLVTIFLCSSLLPFINFNIDKKVLLLVYFLSLLITTAILLAAKAVRHKDISLIAPLKNIKPAFVVILAYFFLSEPLEIKQIIGILIILVSTYLLESDHHLSDFLIPFKNFFKVKYAVYYILAVFLYSMKNIFDKFILSNHLDVFTYFFLIYVFAAVNFNILHALFYGFKDTIDCFKETKYLPFLVAFFSLTANLFVLKAISLTYVSLVIPLVMLNTLFVVIFGGRFFHERYLLFRISMALLILIGAYMIII